MKQYTQKQIRFITECFQNGQKSIQSGNFIQAEKYYLDILKIDSKIIEACNALAFIYTTTHQHTKAVDQLKKILSTNPNDSNVHHNLANNLSDLEQYNEAIKHYQIAIKLNPNYVDSYIQCGITYRKIKEYELAFKYLNDALRLDQKNAKIHHVLAVTNIDIKDYSQAIVNASKAVELATNNKEFFLSLADILKEAGNSYDADIQYHRTCTNFPSYLEAFLSYGRYLIESKFFYEALECFNHANKLAPDDIDILDDLGTCYLGLGDAESAITYFNLALLKEPNRFTSLIGIEQAYQDTGKLDEAINLCDQIIALDNNNPAGYVLKSKVRKSTLNDGLSEHFLNLLSKPQLTDEEKIHIDFSLGKIYDDQKKYAEAFKYYSAGNSIKKQKLSYDRKATETHYSELINFFNSDYFKEHQYLGHDSKLPVMIVGMPRSGTTLTEQIISSHPDVAGAGEIKFWSMTLNGMSHALNTPLTYPQCLIKMDKDHASSIVANYETTLHKIVGVKTTPMHITDKMPHNFLCVGLIAMLFPNVKIIHTKRSPIDTCLSIFFQNFNDSHPYAYDLSDLAHYYQQYERLIQHWHAVLPGRIMDINYADTVSDPEYWSRALISNIGLEWNDACLTPHKLERSVKTASHWQVRQPIYKSSVERWRNYEEFIQPLINAFDKS